MSYSAEYDVYTDGGYDMSRGIGGWAYIVLSGGIEIDRCAGCIERSTNNRAELTAIYNAVITLPVDCCVTVHTDSRYAIGVLSGGYQRKANTDLLDEWDAMIKKRGISVRFEWVKGHSGNEYNEQCDAMCCEACGIPPGESFYEITERSINEIKSRNDKKARKEKKISQTKKIDDMYTMMLEMRDEIDVLKRMLSDLSSSHRGK